MDLFIQKFSTVRGLGGGGGKIQKQNKQTNKHTVNKQNREMLTVFHDSADQCASFYHLAMTSAALSPPRLGATLLQPIRTCVTSSVSSYVLRKTVLGKELSCDVLEVKDVLLVL